MSSADILEALPALLAVAVAVLGFLQRKPIARAFRALLLGATEADLLRERLNDQGDWIAALRERVDSQEEQLVAVQEELASTRAELEAARIAALENGQLRARVAELEQQVRDLEAELVRRRKYTRKDYLKGSEENV